VDSLNSGAPTEGQLADSRRDATRLVPKRFTFRQLAAAGFGPHLIPVMPPNAPLHPDSKVDPAQRGKTPGRYHADSGTWTGLPDWPTRDFTTADHAAWDEWPGANIGARTRELPGIDIDEDSRGYLVEELTALADKMLGRAPKRGRPNSERALLLYRLKPGEEAPPKRRLAYVLEDVPGAVEILGRGQQFVFAGKHKSAVAYTWDDRGTNTGELEDLPEVTDDMLRAFADAAESFLREIGATIVQQTSSGSGWSERKPIGDAALRAHDLGELARALDAIECARLDYNAWIGMLHALKAACGGDNAFLMDAIVPWSMQHAQAIDPQWVIGKWDTIDDSEIGAEHVFGTARNHGFSGGTADAAFDSPPSNDAPSPESDLHAKRNRAPTIRLHTGALDLIAAAAERALVAADDGIYQFGSMLVRPASADIIAADGGKARGTRLIQVKPTFLRERLTFAVRFERFDARAKGWLPANCPPEVAQAILEHGTWSFPVLTGITNCPVLRPDGTILAMPGYDTATGLLFMPADGAAAFPAIGNAPDRAEALEALGEMKTLVATMPYLSGIDRSVALSAILSAIARRAVPLTPMHCFTATGPGQGKSMHSDIVAEIAEGRRAAAIPPGSATHELEKQLVSALIKGDAIISLDNLVEPLGKSAVINACLTQERLDLRVLGKSLNVEVPGNRVLLANGNNLTLESDVTRRALLCQLDARVERPELRGFDNSPINLIRADRGRFVSACLTVLRSFHVAGRPQQATPLGGFEPWSRLVRDALIWLGEADPVSSMEAVRALDQELSNLGRVVSAWHARFGEEPVLARQIAEPDTVDSAFAEATSYTELREALEAAIPSKSALSAKSLGEWLGANRNRIVGQFRLVRETDKHLKTNRWRLERL